MSYRRAISYIRFSTPKQAQGDSYRRQYEATKQYCLENDLTLDESFYDKGVSAYKGENKKHGALGDLLRKIEDGVISRDSVLIVESLDRLSRENVITQMATFIQIIEKGISIVTLADNIVHSNKNAEQAPYTLMMAIGTMMRANEESAMKSKRLSKAWENKRKNIQVKPLTSLLPNWLLIKDGEISENPERVTIVKEIFQLSMSGMGRRAIAKTLNQRKEPIWGSSKRNKSGLWVDSYIQKILNNHAVIGEFQPHTTVNGKRQPIGEPIKNYFPQIIDDKTFYAVQASIRKRTQKGGRAIHKAQNILNSVSYCSYCSSKMIYLNKGSGWKYLKCQKSINEVQCNAPSVHYESVESFFVYEILCNEWLNIFEPSSTESLELSLESKEAELSRQNKIINRYMEAIGHSDDNIVPLISALKEANSKADLIKSEIAEIKAHKAYDDFSQQTMNESFLNAQYHDIDSEQDEDYRRKLRSSIDRLVKIALIQRINDRSVGLILLLKDNRICVGTINPNNGQRTNIVLENWQCDDSKMRLAIKYQVKEFKDHGFSLVPELIKLEAGQNYIAELMSLQSYNNLLTHIPKPTATNIRNLNKRVRDTYNQQKSDLESLTPRIIWHTDSGREGVWGNTSQKRDINAAQNRAKTQKPI